MALQPCVAGDERSALKVLAKALAPRRAARRDAQRRQPFEAEAHVVDALRELGVPHQQRVDSGVARTADVPLPSLRVSNHLAVDKGKAAVQQATRAQQSQ